MYFACKEEKAPSSKIHTDEQIEQIKRSIEEFGMNDPIGVWRDEIVEGHGRLLACQELGHEKVPVIRLDDLSDEQRKAYALVHNKLTMNTGFDLSLLQMELDSLVGINMNEYGFIDSKDEDILLDEFFEVEPTVNSREKEDGEKRTLLITIKDEGKVDEVISLLSGYEYEVIQ